MAFLSPRQSNRSWELSDTPLLRSRTHPLKGLELFTAGSHSVYVNPGIAGFLRRENPDAVVISGYAQWAFASARRHCLRRGIPYVTLTESHLKKPRNRLWQTVKKPWVRRFYGSAAAHLVMGRASQRFVEHFGADPGRIFEFPNTIDVEAHARAVEAARKESAGRAPGFDLLYVGHLARWKGVDTLLRAFARALPEENGLRLHLVGDGPARAALEATASKFLPETVRFHGFVQPPLIPALYAAADAFILPSRHETWGVVLLEAMASHIPILCSDAVGASEDLITPGETGLLFPAGDETALKDTILRIARDRTLGETLSAAAFERARAWSRHRAIDGFGRAVAAALSRGT